MATIHNLPVRSSSIDSFPNRPHDKDGGGTGGGDDMQQRIRDLEKDVGSIKTDIAVMKSNYATKEDVSNAKNSIIMWVVGAVIFAQLIPALPSIIASIKTLLH
jgi:hypothetical protein